MGVILGRALLFILKCNYITLRNNMCLIHNYELLVIVHIVGVTTVVIHDM